MSSDANVKHPGDVVEDNVAIRVTGLSKHYRLYEKPEDRLKESIYPVFNSLLGRKQRRYCTEFSALSDVSFEIKKGDTVGIIGCNGSGKSTLLQMICGTLNPSDGVIEVNGRVAALLELGSGFNPEFSGRENVYLNAMILGMAAHEVDKKFNDIAMFADIGDFIEYPVKTYSSGMMLRLAFAVMAHVEADILVIDEALAVGDAIFIQKCMRFIHSFQKEGTLLLVSHDMTSVQNICKESIWLENGNVRSIGVSKEVTDAYLQSTLQAAYGNDYQLDSIATHDQRQEASVPVEEIESTGAEVYGGEFVVHENLEDAKGWKTGAAELIGLELAHRSKGPDRLFRGGDPVRMTIRALANESLSDPILGFIVKDRLGQDLFGENTLPFTATSATTIAAGEKFKAEFDFVLPFLPNGEYVGMASVANGSLENNTQHNYLHDALVITVSSSKVRWGLAGIPYERVVLEVICG
jgi:lipopolysaccharide transport system ATP-binding protein